MSEFMYPVVNRLFNATVIQWTDGDENGGCVGENSALRDPDQIEEARKAAIEKYRAATDPEEKTNARADLLEVNLYAEVHDLIKRGKVHPGEDGGFYSFESEAQAAGVISRGKSTTKMQLSDIPWPEWAQTALANGWKAPKGWKP